MCGTANPSWSKAKYAARGVHLDQDTAGRLLENVGDHVRREMIVRSTQVFRQNPAYRPFAKKQPPTAFVGGCFTFPGSSFTLRSDMHRPIRRWGLLCVLAACASPKAPVTGVPTPLPGPLPTSPAPDIPSATTWSFTYVAGALSYEVSRTATIQSQSDSSSHTELSNNVTHELVNLEFAGDTIRFTAAIDTFSTATQGSIGPAQTVTLPIQLTGSLLHDSLIISNDSIRESCNPAQSALATDLRNLLVPFPAKLDQGATWKDSTLVKGCQAMIPTAVTSSRSFTVAGETMYEGHRVLAVQRLDTIRAHGEGAQQQHPLVLDALGTGKALYYLSTGDGHVVHLSTEHDLNLSVSTSGQVHRFRQSSKQEFKLAP